MSGAEGFPRGARLSSASCSSATRPDGAAVVDEDDVVDRVLDLMEHVAGEQYCAAGMCEPAQERPKPGDSARVEAVRWLIQREDVGSPSIAVASARRWRIPVENVPIRRSAYDCASTSDNTVSTRDRPSPRVPRTCEGERVPSCADAPTRCPAQRPPFAQAQSGAHRADRQCAPHRCPGGPGRAVRASAWISPPRWAEEPDDAPNSARKATSSSATTAPNRWKGPDLDRSAHGCTPDRRSAAIDSASSVLEGSRRTRPWLGQRRSVAAGARASSRPGAALLKGA